MQEQVIHIIVKPGRHTVSVNELTDSFIVHVTAKAHDGAANEQLIAVLADYLNVPKSCMRIVRGHRARQKTVVITSPV